MRSPVSPCKKCGGERRRKPSGQAVCDPCKRQESIDYRKRNQETIKAYTKKHYAEHKEQESERHKRWYAENTELAKQRKHPLRSRHTNMIHRCYNENCEAYANYGARGITVCDRWLGEGGFERYVEDVYPTYVPGLTLDRIDNDGNYEPNNVRWVSRTVQNNNTRTKLKYKLSIPANTPVYSEYGVLGTLMDFCKLHNLPLIIGKYRYAQHANEDWILHSDVDNRYYEYDGHRYNMTELSLLSNLRFDVIRSRIQKYGWTVARAVETPSSGVLTLDLPRG